MSRDRKGLLLGLTIALIVVSVPAVGIFILDAMFDSARKIDLVAGVIQGYVTGCCDNGGRRLRNISASYIQDT